MSIRNYKKEIELEDIETIINDVRRVQKRLTSIENDLLDLKTERERQMNNCV